MKKKLKKNLQILLQKFEKILKIYSKNFKNYQNFYQNFLQILLLKFIKIILKFQFTLNLIYIINIYKFKKLILYMCVFLLENFLFWKLSIYRPRPTRRAKTLLRGGRPHCPTLATAPNIFILFNINNLIITCDV